MSRDRGTKLRGLRIKLLNVNKKNGLKNFPVFLKGSFKYQ